MIFQLDSGERTGKACHTLPSVLNGFSRTNFLYAFVHTGLYIAFGGERESLQNNLPRSTLFPAILCKKSAKSTYFFTPAWAADKIL